jgi:hypothetical protein
MKRQPLLILISAVMMLGGCATIPPGPSVMVLPAPGKPFEAFRADDGECRQWAEAQTGLSGNDTVNHNLAAGAAIGTLMGAGLGAAIGAASGNAATGLAIGAAGGLIGGSAVAGNHAVASGWEAQRRYDTAYQQCMFAKGNQIPGAETAVRRARRAPPMPPPPPARYAPPPPPPYSSRIP